MGNYKYVPVYLVALLRYLTYLLEITLQPAPHCQQLAEYLNRRLEKPSACVKLKVLKIMLHLISNGHISFRQYLRRNDSSIKLATMYNGPPDPLLGVTPYENVRRSAQINASSHNLLTFVCSKELLDLLFNPALIQQDESLGDTSYSEDKGRLQLGGLGTTGSNRGKYEGFGSSPLEKEETIKDKMIDMLEKLMNPTDETAEKIKSALTSSPGNYEAVLVDPLIVSNSDVPSPQARTSVKIRAHVPGRAGGGWESEDDDTQQEEVVHSSPNSGSTVSVDSLEKDQLQLTLLIYHSFVWYNNFILEIQFCQTSKSPECFLATVKVAVCGKFSTFISRIDPATTELTPAREYVNEFCSVQQWPVSLSHLNETCKKCATLNCSDILHALGNILLQSPDSTSDVTRMRALLMLEWFVRTDLITPGTFSRILSVPLNHVLTSESIGQDVKVKAQKVRLILDKLQPRRG
ncbi:hypothetical protein ANN_04881 [Periplaneta americana]|uniref:Uncharacterized protein n=1 Tax=Periplaneta americana TaxID=6978 RepID=A0ABQ8TAE8_PERAM|nr:hypothetical protein ANN_04881 [Periplaneta americana]